MSIGKPNPILLDLKRWNKSASNTLPGNMVLDPDFKEFFQLLNKNNVKYLFVGGFAVAFHGYPRYTKEIDIWLRIDPDNATNVVKTLDDFGFQSLGLTKDDFLESETIIQLGYPPNRIDLMSTATGVDFDECYQSKIDEEIDGVRIPFIDLDNLKMNKKAAGRTQDLADIDNLK